MGVALIAVKGAYGYRGRINNGQGSASLAEAELMAIEEGERSRPPAKRGKFRDSMAVFHALTRRASPASFFY